MKHRKIAAVAKCAQQLDLVGSRVGDGRERLIGVRRHDDVVVAFRSAARSPSRPRHRSCAARATTPVSSLIRSANDRVRRST